jgi:hypothetical protein
MPAEASYRYRAYGLLLEINRLVPALLPSQQTRRADVRIQLKGETGTADPPVAADLLYRSPGQARDGTPYFTVARVHAEAGSCIECRHVSESGEGLFTIDAAAEHVDVSWTRGMPVDDLIAYLIGPVIGCLLRLRTTVCLHAGVISIDDQAVVVIGAKGAGKSTLTAAFAYDGNPILADDIAALRDEGAHLAVQPGYPRLRLWPDAIESITARSARDSPLVMSSMDKRLQMLTEDPAATRWRFQSQSLPLAAIYLLDPHRSRKPPLVSGPMKNDAAAMFALMSNTYANYVCNASMRGQEMKLLARVLRSVPLMMVRPQSGFDGVRRLRDLIRRNMSRARPFA